MHPCAFCGVIYNSHDMEATQASVDRRMYKENVVYTQ